MAELGRTEVWSECAIRQYAALTKASGCAHLDPSELWSKREGYSAWISWCCCSEWKRLCVFLYIKPHITKRRNSRKSLLSNSLYSASKMPSFRALSLKQGSEWVDVTWDDFWRLKCRSVREVTSGVEYFALLMLCTSLCSDLAGNQTHKELLSFLSFSSLHCESSPLKIIIGFTPLLRIC